MPTYRSRNFTNEKRVLNLVYDNIAKHGIEPMQHVLRHMKKQRTEEVRDLVKRVRISEETPEQKEKIQLALEKCCDLFQIKKPSDLYKSSRRGKYAECRHLLMVVMKNLIGLKERAIADHWERDSRIVYRALQEFSDKDKRHIIDKTYLQKYELVKIHLTS